MRETPLTVRLEKDGRDIATWTLTDPPTGTPQAEIDGAWHDLTVTGTAASISICGPDMDPPEPGAVVITASQRPRVRVDDVIREAERIELI
jgi:hypothetical protein